MKTGQYGGVKFIKKSTPVKNNLKHIETVIGINIMSTSVKQIA